MRRADLLRIALVLSIGLVGFFWAEKLEVSDGFGWDGVNYGTWAQDLHRSFVEEDATAYDIQRLLPSAIVHFSLRMFGVSLEPEKDLELWGMPARLSNNVLMGFRIYHLLLLLPIAYMWNRILAELNVHGAAAWLGFIALFGNFALLKEYHYDPVTTDPTALFLSLLLLLLYLRRCSLGVLLTAAAGAFCWPTILIFGLLLYVFPREERMPEASAVGGARLLAVATTLGVLAGGLYVVFVAEAENLYGAAPVVRPWVPATVVFLALYIFKGSREIYRNGLPQLAPQRVLAQLSFRRIAVAVVLFGTIRLILAIWSDIESPAATTIPSFLQEVARRSLVRPLDFAVTFPMYFGPILILCALLWPRVCRVVAGHGIGALGFVLAHFLLSVNQDARQSLLAFPFFAAFTLQALDRSMLSRALLWTFGVGAVFLSKVWYRINVEPLEGELLEFPMQRYQMNFGAWMANETYVAQGLAVVAVAASLFIVLRRTVKRGAIG